MGYYDKQAHMLLKQFNIINRSQYFNNFDPGYLPPKPTVGFIGGYNEIEFRRQEEREESQDDCLDTTIDRENPSVLIKKSMLRQKIEINMKVAMNPRFKGQMLNLNKNQCKPKGALAHKKKPSEEVSSSENIEESCRVDTNEEGMGLSISSGSIGIEEDESKEDEGPEESDLSLSILSITTINH